MALEFFLTNNLSSTLLQEVEEFLDDQETGHPFQFPQWLDPGSRLVLWREEKRIRWAGGFSIHSPFGWKVQWIRAAAANRGPVCDDRKLWAEVVNQLAEQMRRERLSFFDVSPDWIQRSADEPEDVFNNTEWKLIEDGADSLRLDLTRSTDEIFSNFSKNTRYEVRRAERAGTTVTMAAGVAELEEFQRLYQQLAFRKGFQPDVAERQRRQISWLMSAPSRGVLLLARAENAVLGGVVVARAGRRCWYIWGASDKRPQLNVGHILQWHALRWAKSQGCTEYDFGGYTPGATSGPAWFKAGFGGTAVGFVGPRRRVLQSATYRVFTLLSKIR